MNILVSMQVGYGDVVAQSFVGKTCVVIMIAIGLVLIPVQAALFYNEISARRVIRGEGFQRSLCRVSTGIRIDNIVSKDDKDCCIVQPSLI